MNELFVPHGSNPLQNVKVGNARCCRIEFDRTVRGNILVLDGDLTQSRIQIPKEDRPVSSLQLSHPLLVLQLFVPSSGQFLVEVTTSSSPMTRMKLSAGTFISKADVGDVKGMAHCKVPLAIPRNTWVQVVFHISGIFSQLFNLPSVRWIDTIVVAGSCKLRKLACCSDEELAISSRPSGMLLFAVPAYGPPVWATSVRETKGGGGSVDDEAEANAAVASTSRSPRSAPPLTRNPAAGDAATPPPLPSAFMRPNARGAGGDDAGQTARSVAFTTSAAVPSATSPLKMKFSLGPDGKVSFTASNPEVERAKREEEEQARREAEARERALQEHEAFLVRRQQLQRELEEECSYVRLVEPNAGSNGVGDAPPTRGSHVRASSINAQQSPLSMGGGAAKSSAPRVVAPGGPRGAAASAAPGPGASSSHPTTPVDQALNASSVATSIAVESFAADPWGDDDVARNSAPLVIPGYIAPARVVAAAPNSPSAIAAGSKGQPTAAKVSKPRVVQSIFRKGSARAGGAGGRGSGTTPTKPAKAPSELILTLPAGGDWSGGGAHGDDGGFDGGFGDSGEAAGPHAVRTAHGVVVVPRGFARGLVGYGVGFMDVIHAAGTDSDEEDDEDDGDEEEE